MLFYIDRGVVDTRTRSYSGEIRRNIAIRPDMGMTQSR